jgi:hypothetical protein
MALSSSIRMVECKVVDSKSSRCMCNLPIKKILEVRKTQKLKYQFKSLERLFLPLLILTYFQSVQIYGNYPEF